MAWLSREPAKLKNSTDRKSFPSGIWHKCQSCAEIILLSDFEENHKVCPKCNYHHRLTVEERLDVLIDKDSFFEWDFNLVSTDPLGFHDGKSQYSKKLQALREKTKRSDAIVTGVGKLEGNPVAIGIMDFFWMGGSMGSVVGEKIKRLFTRARILSLPVVIVSSSGGARMHESLFSLMQMVKTSAAVSLHRESGFPFISVLADPTTGGVAASFSLLGDINIAEPVATIGFAGRRVIENTIRQKLPDNFQTSEFCQEHGVIDKIVKRSELKKTISTLVSLLSKRQG